MLERIDSLTRTVRESIRFSVGCNTIPLFANVSGGSWRTIFEFRCVFEGCSAFFDVRTFSGVDSVKWAVMGVSHCHSFEVFPCQMPRNTFPDDVLQRFQAMAADKVNAAEIKLKITSFATGMFSECLASCSQGTRHRPVP